MVAALGVGLVKNARLPFAKHAYQAESLPAMAQRCINLYAEQMPPDSPSPWVLVQMPGAVAFAECGAGPIRAVVEFGGAVYVVSGAQVYSVVADGTATLLGSVTDGAGRIEHAASVTELCLVDPASTRAWVVKNGALSEIVDDDFPGAVSVAYLSGFFVFVAPDGKSWFWSEILAAEEIDALSFVQVLGPDGLRAVTVDHQDLLLFGATTAEVWTLTGQDPDNPFQRMPGASMERGIAAAGSLVQVDNSVFWLGDDRIVYRAAGYSPVRISTHAIEWAIAGYGSVADAWGWEYTDAGHKFYVLTFPAAGATWVYDAATQLWHERQSGVAEAATRWRFNCGAAAFNRQLVGDSLSGGLYRLNRGSYTEAGEPMRRLAASPPLRVDGNRFRLHAVTLEAEVGVGLSSGQGSDPQVMLRYSRDGGRTWGPQLWRSLGAIGEYRQRARWLRLGQARELVFEVEVTDPVKIALYGLTGQPQVDAA